MAFCTLGNLRFRVDPQAFNWDYSIDVNVIETLGGQVVQVLGATLGDITITGQFGADRAHKLESWQLAEAFSRKIQSMMDAQTLPASAVKVRTAGGKTIINRNVHNPVALKFQDGVHNWNFQVLIKSLVDPDDGGVIRHRTGKFSYRYALTLFIVESKTDQLLRAAKDDFISRLSKGLGWKQSKYNGQLDAGQLQTFLQAATGSSTTYGSGVMG